MNEQLLLESASRIILFSWLEEQQEINSQFLVPHLRGDTVAIDLVHMTPQVFMRFMVACSAERLVPDIEARSGDLRRFVLRQHTKSANPILDLMNDYEVWKQQHRR